MITKQIMTLCPTKLWAGFGGLAASASEPVRLGMEWEEAHGDMSQAMSHGLLERNLGMLGRAGGTCGFLLLP